MTEGDGYREFAPPAALREHIECFWVARGPSPARAVLPDGCVDFLFDRGTGPAAPGARLVGAMTAPLALPPAAARDVVAVRFRPGGAAPFVRASLAELTDAAVELAALGRAFAELGRLGTEPDAPAERLRGVTAWLVARLPAAAGELLRALGAFTSNAMRVDAAAAELGVSRQHFTRCVPAHTGLPPRLLARIVRLRRALADDPRRPAAALAAAHGYADQAHLCRDARELGGAPLAELRG